MIRLDPDTVETARQGSRAALELIIRAAERPVFALALRMLADRADAEDATQEILIKILTHLGTLRDPAAAGAWAMRLACRHLVELRRMSRVEAMRLTFTGFAADLEEGLAPLADAALDEAEAQRAIAEVKVGCTLAMLTCLNRAARIAYLLGDVFEMTDQEAAMVLEINPAAYRQRLRRARAVVQAFVSARCGLVNREATCTCERRVCAAMAAGRVRPGASAFGLSDGQPGGMDALRSAIERMEAGRRAAALMRSQPDFPHCMDNWVSELLDRHLAGSPQVPGIGHA